MQSKTYRKHIFKDNFIINSNCRKCDIAPEAIEYLFTGCTPLAPREYEHNDVANVIKIEICMMFGIAKLQI